MTADSNFDSVLVVMVPAAGVFQTAFPGMIVAVFLGSSRLSSLADFVSRAPGQFLGQVPPHP